jgi:hypothetical protein
VTREPISLELEKRLVSLDPSFADLPESLRTEVNLIVAGSAKLKEALVRSEKGGVIDRCLYDLIQLKMNPEFKSEPECEREFHYQEYLRFLESQGEGPD